MDAHTRQLIADTESEIAGLHNAIRCIRTDIDRPDLVDKDIAERREAIAMHERVIARRLANREHGREIINSIQQNISELRSKVRQMEASDGLEKLSAMVAEANELQSQAYGEKGLVDNGQGQGTTTETDAQRVGADSNSQ